MKRLGLLIAGALMLARGLGAQEFPADEVWRCDLQGNSEVWSEPWADDEGDVSTLIAAAGRAILVKAGEIVWESPQFEGTITALSRIDFGLDDGARLLVAVMKDTTSEIKEFYGQNFAQTITHSPDFLFCRSSAFDEHSTTTQDNRRVQFIIPVHVAGRDSARTVLIASWEYSDYREDWGQETVFFGGVVRRYSLASDETLQSLNLGYTLDYAYVDIDLDGTSSYFFGCNGYQGTRLHGDFTAIARVLEVSDALESISELVTSWCNSQSTPFLNRFCLFPSADERAMKIFGVGFHPDPEAPVAVHLPNLYQSDWPNQGGLARIDSMGYEIVAGYESAETGEKYAIYPRSDGRVISFPVDERTAPGLWSFEGGLLDMHSIKSERGVRDELLVLFRGRVALCRVTGSLSVPRDSPSLIYPSTLSLTSFPNPFNSSTTISYTLPKPGRYALDVVDIRGRLVTRLTDGWKEAGSYRSILQGGELPSGTFVLRLNGEDASAVQKIELVR